MTVIRRFLHDIGFLRGALVVVVLSLIALAPFAGGPAQFSGWGLVVTVVAPAFYVVVLFVLPLDMLMTRVFMSDKSGAERARFRRILWTEAVLLVLMIASWAPFVAKLLRIA